ncbi:MAG: hypothetical protein HF975_02635 [ANME-2 cluster archaeon]|nr:hypothetical protein [ANME-2 cluster archaeon]
MPYSDPTYDSEIENFIKKNNFVNYLDIGAGSGKYAEIIRRHIQDANIVGVEADISYIKEFNLNKNYTKIYNQFIEEFIDENPDFLTDVAIIGDCIEHLKKSDGLDLLHYLVYRTRYILVIFPTQYIQYSWNGHSSEAHRSVWDKHDFIQFKYVFKKKGIMNLVTIKGFLGDSGTTYVAEIKI